MKRPPQAPAAILAIVVLFLISGCDTTSYDRTLDPSFDLRTMKTFSMIPVPLIPEWDDSPLSILASDNFSMDSIKSALEEKGYHYVNDEEADFKIQVRVECMNRKKFSESDNSKLAFSWEPMPPPHQTDQGYRKEISDERHIQTPRGAMVDTAETYLIIEAIETATSRVAWRGWARSGKPKPFEGIDNISETVSIILEHFPN